MNMSTPRWLCPLLLLVHGGVSGCGGHSGGHTPDAAVAATPATNHDAGSSHDAAADSGDIADIAADCEIPATGLPSDMFCTGLYAQHDPTRYAAGVMPYTPGVTLWSDGADKRRYLQLPAGSKIDTSQLDAWKFPVGTKSWKEFRFDGKLVETRMFWKRTETTWASGTYIWDSTGKNATLNTSKQPVLLASGYEIPTAKDCGKCHHGGSDNLLGIEALALGLPTAEGATLSKLVEMGALTDPPSRTSVTLPEDATGMGGFALGYLHANCGMPCHSTRGLGHETELVLRLRADEVFSDGPHDATKTDSYLATLKKEPTTASVAQKFPGALRITPGAHDKSLIWLLAARRGDYQMPPLVSHVVDEKSLEKLAAWIDAISP